MRLLELFSMPVAVELKGVVFFLGNAAAGEKETKGCQRE